MFHWKSIFIVSVALIVFDLLTVAVSAKFGYSAGNPAEIAALLGVIGIIISLGGYIISHRSISVPTDLVAVQRPSWRTPIFFIIGMLAGWVPLFILEAMLSHAPDGGGIGGAIIAIAGLTFAILENVVLVVITLFAPGFKKMIDGYLATLIVYVFAFLAYSMIGNYTWNLYIIPFALWVAFALLMFGFRYSARRKTVIIISGGVVLLGLFVFMLTLPNSYLSDEWLYSLAKRFNKTEWCLNITQKHTLQECVRWVSSQRQDPALCHLAKDPVQCLGNIRSLKKSSDACNGITDSQARQFCILQSESFMMAKRAHELRDPSLCQQPNLEQRSYCMWEAEKEAGRRPNCLSLPDPAVGQKCLYGYPTSKYNLR